MPTDMSANIDASKESNESHMGIMKSTTFSHCEQRIS